MRVLLDECLPRKLTQALTGHDAKTVPETGWAGLKNGELLRAAAGQFDAFITVDRNLAAQQRVAQLPFGVVVLGAPRNDIGALRPPDGSRACNAGTDPSRSPRSNRTLIARAALSGGGNWSRTTKVKRLWETLDAIAAGASDPVLSNGKKAPRLVLAGAAKLLLLLGTRRSETLNMRWADIDERAQTWTVPGIFRRGGRTHVVPLPLLALRILADLRPVSEDTPWVFVGKRGASVANNPARWTEVLRNASGLDFTLHDLRRTCATGAR